VVQTYFFGRSYRARVRRYKMPHSDKYEYVNEATINSALICTICQEPSEDPRITPCEHIFCLVCITRWIQNDNASCPIDRKLISISTLMHVNKPLRNLSNDLEVKCKICGQTKLKRSDFDNHINNICPKANVICLAADIMCQWVGRREELNDHMKRCEYQRVREWLPNSSSNINEIFESMSSSLNRSQR
jgi:hypothetical protein